MEPLLTGRLDDINCGDSPFLILAFPQAAAPNRKCVFYSLKIDRAPPSPSGQARRVSLSTRSHPPRGTLRARARYRRRGPNHRSRTSSLVSLSASYRKAWKSVIVGPSPCVSTSRATSKAR